MCVFEILLFDELSVSFFYLLLGGLLELCYLLLFWILCCMILDL